jgi:hypothetical protein
VPSSIVISIASWRDDDPHRLLVKGVTLGNCEAWKEKLSRLPESLEGSCEVINPGGARRIAAVPQEVGLFLVTKKPNGDGGDDGPNVGLIVGIVIAAVVVVAVVVAVVVICVVKKGGSGGAGLNDA